MAETDIAIPATPTVTTPTPPPVLIKTFSALDINGNLVEIQAITQVDEIGRIEALPLTEATGQQILAALLSINNILFESTNCGAPITGVGTAGTQG